MSIDEAFNFKRIDDRVATAGLLLEEQLEELAGSGYEAVINLLPMESEYAISNEEEIVRDQGLDYTHIPVDFSNPTEQDYQAFVNAMVGYENKRLLVHCAANFRVSAFYAIYARQNLGWSSAKAREHIGAIWSPAEHPPWDAFVAKHLG